MQNDLLDDVLPKAEKLARRQLLPTWMKVFIWIFMALGGLAIPVFIFGLLGFNVNLALYGFETNQPMSVVGISLLTVFIFKGLVSYSLWREKDWATILGMVDAVLGLVICLVSHFGVSYLDEYRTGGFRLEILFLIPYLVKLYYIEGKWREEL